MLYCGWKQHKKLPFFSNRQPSESYLVSTRDEPDYLFAKIVKQYGDVFSFLKVGGDIGNLLVVFPVIL